MWRMQDAKLAREVQELLAGPYMRVNTTSDVIGVEICGALKNVLAIAAGIVEGLNLGNNAMAALLTQARLTRGPARTTPCVASSNPETIPVWGLDVEDGAVGTGAAYTGQRGQRASAHNLMCRALEILCHVGCGPGSGTLGQGPWRVI